jgi:GNAT superfamily N-acetyltransferase
LWDIERRPARADGADALSAIAQAARTYWGYPPEWLTGWREELTVTRAAIDRDRYLVAEAAGAPVGFLALRTDETTEIEHLWVAPSHMKRGTGGRLLATTLEYCREAGIGRVRVVADPHAADFSRRHGARDVGEAPSTPDTRRLPVLEFHLRTVGAEV